MGWAAGNYSPFAPGEDINIAFNFTNVLQSSSIVSAALTVTSLPIAPVIDPNPQNIVIEGPQIVGPQVNFRIGNGLNGALYLLNCQASLGSGATPEQWAELPCIGPPPYPPA